MKFGILNIFRKSFEKLQISPKSRKNSAYFTCTPVQICDNISQKASQNRKYFRQRCRENQNTHFMSTTPHRQFCHVPLLHAMSNTSSLFYRQMATESRLLDMFMKKANKHTAKLTLVIRMCLCIHIQHNMSVKNVYIQFYFIFIYIYTQTILLYIYIYTGCFTTLGHNCRR